MVELVKPELLFGSEKRIFEFISRLNDSDKLVLITHTDMDGVVAAKVANAVLSADLVKFVDYEDINYALVDELKRIKARNVVITDLNIDDPTVIKMLEKFCNVLILDHHLSHVDLNSDRTTYVCSSGSCASYMCYYYFSMIKDLSSLDWIVASACVADWMYDKNKSWMRQIYEKYGEKFMGTIEGVAQGKFWRIVETVNLSIIYFEDKEGSPRKVYEQLGEKFGELGDLGKYSSEVGAEIKSALKEFEKKRQSIADGYFYEINSKFPIKSLVCTEIGARIRDKTIILAQVHGKNYGFSARRQDGKISTEALLKKLTQGFENASAGGHFKASGGHVMLKDAEAFKERLMVL